MGDAHKLRGSLATLDQGFRVTTVILTAEGQLFGDSVAEKLGTRILED